MKYLTILIDALNEFCKAYEKGNLKPLLEADVAGYMYHLLVAHNRGDASQIHLSTRIKSKGEGRKFPDIVMGNVLTRLEQINAYENAVQSDSISLLTSKEEALRGLRTRSFDEYSRPFVAHIELAIEVKALLKAFEYGQLRRRVIQSKSDIEALARKINAKQRLLLLFDEAGFLVKTHKQRYLQELVKYKNELDPEIMIIHIRVDSNGKCDWKFVN